MREDVASAISTASYMGISAKTFRAQYKYTKFAFTADLRKYVGGYLENAPNRWSYENSISISVDQHGNQPRGSDRDRIKLVGKLRRIPLL